MGEPRFKEPDYPKWLKLYYALDGYKFRSWYKRTLSTKRYSCEFCGAFILEGEMYYREADEPYGTSCHNCACAKSVISENPL